MLPKIRQLRRRRQRQLRRRRQLSGRGGMSCGKKSEVSGCGGEGLPGIRPHSSVKCCLFEGDFRN